MKWIEDEKQTNKSILSFGSNPIQFHTIQYNTIQYTITHHTNIVYWNNKFRFFCSSIRFFFSFVHSFIYSSSSSSSSSLKIFEMVLFGLIEELSRSFCRSIILLGFFLFHSHSLYLSFTSLFLYSQSIFIWLDKLIWEHKHTHTHIISLYPSLNYS